jgi:hypothetical protein
MKLEYFSFMSDSDKKTDDQKFNDTLKRMLETPPKPHVKESLTESDHQEKPSDSPAKKSRSEKS